MLAEPIPGGCCVWGGTRGAGRACPGWLLSPESCQGCWQSLSRVAAVPEDMPGVLAEPVPAGCHP